MTSLNIYLKAMQYHNSCTYENWYKPVVVIFLVIGVLKCAKAQTVYLVCEIIFENNLNVCVNVAHMLWLKCKVRVALTRPL